MSKHRRGIVIPIRGDFRKLDRQVSRLEDKGRDRRHPITGCRADRLLGTWLVDPVWFDGAVAQALSYDLSELARHRIQMRESSIDLPQESRRGYRTTANGTAIVSLSGALTKHPTSFQDVMGGTATQSTIKALRMAVADPAVRRIMMLYDGVPGGNADGAFDCAEEIRRTDLVKPVYAHAEDQCTSGGQLLASQARYLTANSNAMMGSVGVLSFLVDTSEQFKKEGIKVIPVTGGKLKGVGAPGNPIPKQHIEAFQRRVDDIYGLFLRTVGEARGLRIEDIRALEADTMIASRAKGVGLIDDIMTLDDAIARAEKDENPAPALRGPGKRKVTLQVAPSAGLSPARSKAMPFSADQLNRARSLPGLAHISEEDAEGRVLILAQEQNRELAQLRQQVQTLEAAKPQELPPHLAEGNIKLFIKEAEFAVREGKLLPAQHEIIKTTLMPNGKPDVSMVKPDGTVLLPASAIQKIVESNKPHGLTETQSGQQPQHRTEPGDGDKKDDAVPSPERINQLRSAVGLDPLPVK